LIDKAYPKWYHFTYRGELKLAVSTALSKVKDMDKVQDFFDGFFGDYTNYKKDDQNRTDDLRPTLSFAQLPHRDYHATVYYDVRGKGEDFVESVLINEPTMLTRPKDPVFDGWKFVEWYVDEELTQAYDFATVIDTTDDVTIKLYAKWMAVITFTLGDVEKKYDGTPIEILYKYKGSLPKSCVVSVEVDTMLVDAGEVVYHVTRTGIWNGTTEVTNNYVIEWTIDSASMRVTKRWMEITTATDSMAYNGIALTAEDTTMVGDGWVDGEGIDITFTGEQTEEGMSENTMEYEPWEGTNLANYDIQVVYGWLIVTPEEKPTWLVVPKKMEETEKVWLNNRLLIRKGNRLYDVCGQEW